MCQRRAEFKPTRGIVVYTDVENAWEDLDSEGVKCKPWVKFGTFDPGTAI